MLVTFLNSVDCSFIGKSILLVLLLFYPISNSNFVFFTNFQKDNVQAVFTSIQQAINEAENGSTVLVPSGIYLEHVVVNKSVSLVGENMSTTIIDGGSSGTVVTVVADNAIITGFTIRNSGWGWTRNGIYVHYANYVEIRNNLLIHNCHNIRLNYSYESHVEGNVIQGDGYGIRLIHSVGCVARNNSVYGCIGGVHLEYAVNCTVKENYFAENSQGIRLYSPCTYNRIFANNVYNNSYEGMIEAMPQNMTFFDNVFFHNNFINNTNSFIYKVSGNIWDDGYPSGGNYWSRYNGTDSYKGSFQNETGSDGIGDLSYAVNGFDEDRYPLMHPYGSIRNLDTNLTYLTVQSAIDATETLDDHTLYIKSGVYYENLKIYKSLVLLGESGKTTILDGRKTGTVLFIEADHVNVSSFTIQNSGLYSPPLGMDCGVFLNYSVGCSVSHCIIADNQIGIYVFFSESNMIENNVVSCNSKNGVWLWCSGNNVLVKNDIKNSSYNFGVFGGNFSDFNNNIDASNLVDGKPVKYVIGVKDEIFEDEDNIGVLYVVNGVNVTVRDLNLTRNGHGVLFYNTTNSRIDNVTVSDNNYGIYLQDSDDNFIADSFCLRNWVGVCIEDSNNNTVENSVLGDSEKGFSLYKANYNLLEGNTIANNLYGIRLFYSHKNTIFHNSLIENTEQVSLISSYQNVWDNGCEGNYWSDYNGADSNGDGIGDTLLPWSDLDYYPLVSPYLVGDVNHDGKVNIFDIVKVAASYNTTPSDSKWNPHADIAEPYGVIDMFDIMKVTTNYGKRWVFPFEG